MYFDVARQSFIPAFLTLFGAVVAFVCLFDPLATVTTSSVMVPPLTEMLNRFQETHPIWTKIVAVWLLMVSGLSVGRMAVRYNLYSVNTCLPIALFAIICCGGLGRHIVLSELVSLLFLVLATKHLFRSFRHDYGFDGIFRAGLYLGISIMAQPQLMPMLLLLPAGVVVFRRTFREVVVAIVGLLLGPATLCYIHWGMGGEFLDPLLSAWDNVVLGKPFVLLDELLISQKIFLAIIVLFDIAGFGFFFSHIYAVGTKPRFILGFQLAVFLLVLLVLCGPTATTGDVALLAIPSAIILPFFWVRTRRIVSSFFYLVLLFAALFGLFIEL